MKLWDFLRNKMLQNPNQIVCESEAKMTYEEMVVFAEMFSKQLQGIKCCAILCNCEMMAALALVSCFAAKVTAVPLSMRYGELHCNKILDTISPDAIITDFEGELQVTLINDALYKEPSIHPALIMCTSGTTGKPKGAMLSEKNIITNVSDIADYFDIGSADTILLARPLYHCAVLTGEFLTGLIKGVKIRFYSDYFNPPKMLELIKKYEITTFCGTPTLLSTEIEASMKIDSRVKEVLVFGFETKFGTQIGMKIAGEFSGVDEVKQLCLECLPTYQIPTSIELVSELPRNGSGKIIRR